jgi:hypothetical protein
LQLQAGRELSAEERDVMRAEIARLRLQSVDGPRNVSLESPPPNPETNDE